MRSVVVLVGGDQELASGVGANAVCGGQPGVDRGHQGG